MSLLRHAGGITEFGARSGPRANACSGRAVCSGKRGRTTIDGRRNGLNRIAGAFLANHSGGPDACYDRMRHEFLDWVASAMRGPFRLGLSCCLLASALPICLVSQLALAHSGRQFEVVVIDNQL